MIYETIIEDGRYYNEIDVVSISIGMLGENLEIKKTLYHELRHKYQLKYIETHNDELAIYFANDLNDYSAFFEPYVLFM